MGAGYHYLAALSFLYPAMSTRFCLIRHGETDWNAEKRIQGQIDIDLNATGEAQARAVRPGLAGQRFNAIYSSDLARAWRTAEIATAELAIAVSPAPTLRERHYGVFQGLTAPEAKLQQPEAYHHHHLRTPDYAYGNGETLIAFSARIMDTLNHLAEQHRGGVVLAFTHGGVLDIVYRVATGRLLETPRDFAVPNAALNWLDCSAGAWTLRNWGDRRHLERALDEVVE
jgi:probable phosphoglycerate mutase